MDAVLRVDLECHRAVVLLQPFVDAGRAIAGRGAAEHAQLARPLQVHVRHLQVARLVLGMVGEGVGDGCEPVEADLAVRLGIFDRLVEVGALQFGIVAVMLHRRDHADLQLAHPHVEARHYSTELAAELCDHRLGILDQLQFLGDPAVAQVCFVVGQLGVFAARCDRRGSALGRQHAALHGGMAALDARHVHEASRTADKRATRESEPGHRLPAALVDCTRAVGDAGAALEVLPDARMMLPALEFLEGRDVGIPVIERGHETQCHLAVGLVVEEATAPAVAFRQWPALRVQYPARHVLVGIDIPQFLDADAIDLRLAIRLKVELRFHLLGEVAARALCEERVLGVDFHAGLVIAFLTTVGSNAHVLRDHAGDRAIVGEHHLGGGEAGEHHHAQPLGLFGQPAAQVPERAGVTAIVRHERRHEDVRDRHVPAPGQVPVPVVGDGRFRHRAFHVAPFGQQLVKRPGIDHRPGKDMCPDLGALFQDDDFEFFVQLLQADRRGKAGRPAANDHHINRHAFAFAHASIS